MLDYLRRQRPSPAMVVALLSLMISLGGSSYAAITLSKNSVKSKHIAQGAVTRSDIARDAVNSARVKDFTLVANDFKQGQLPVGPSGPKGDPGATNVTVRVAHGDHTVTANCEPGERATGGGAHSVNGVVVGQGPAGTGLTFYAPVGSQSGGYMPTAWSAAAEAEPGLQEDVTAWVVCAAP